MAVQISIKAKVRDQIGKGANRRLRRTGFTPAVLYGNREKSLPICFNTNDFLKRTHGELHENVIFNLDIEGDPTPQKEQIRAIIKELQFEPLKDTLVHIDFYEMVAGRLISMEVPVEVVGEARGVKVEGGTLEHLMREILVECLPRLIPESIRVDVSNLGAGEAMHVRDIQPPEGIKILDDPEKVVLTILHGAKATEVSEPSTESKTS